MIARLDRAEFINFPLGNLSNLLLQLVGTVNRLINQQEFLINQIAILQADTPLKPEAISRPKTCDCFSYPQTLKAGSSNSLPDIIVCTNCKKIREVQGAAA